MLGSRRVVQNETVAEHMRAFFRQMKRTNWIMPEEVAKAYGNKLWNPGARTLCDEKELSRSRFYVGLSLDSVFHDLESVTKRAALVSDTLLLSHEGSGEYHDLGRPLREKVEIECPDLAELGQWIMAAEPLLKAGLVWYMPAYAVSGSARDESPRTRPCTIDYLIKDRRAVDVSGAEPIKGRMVRPVLEVELPFVEGVNLRDFGEITVQEFDSYSSFRDFMRRSLLEMDTLQNSVHSDRELAKLGLDIKDQVRAARAEMVKARRKKALNATGAAIGSVGAVLVAVYGPSLASAVAAVGASGGVWGFVKALMEDSTRTLKEDKWHYVWMLAKKSDVRTL